YREKRHTLRRLLDEITLTVDNLPQPRTAEEADYQNLIKTLFDFKQALANEMGEKYADMVDYYTLWAHQIKTPIAAMRLTLQSGEFSQSRELAEYLQRIEQYVEMVLCYLRLGSETNDFLIKKYDLDGIIRQAVRKFSSQFIRRKIKLIYEPVGVTVLTDEKWLLFVLEQVLSNALKYTKSGEIEITLEEPKTVCIRDTGIGISPEDINRIFEKGYTGYNGRTDKKASGIGLYLCRQICGKLGHKITAQSQVGKGTLIKIDLAEADVEIE
ncbi:MAG: sensor histidine kinase, partial [Oscillospiraceae bacterium]|nr:sensor histidine kinase [Oscillospiraceae bacterium]